MYVYFIMHVMQFRKNACCSIIRTNHLSEPRLVLISSDNRRSSVLICFYRKLKRLKAYEASSPDVGTLSESEASARGDSYPGMFFAVPDDSPKADIARPSSGIFNIQCDISNIRGSTSILPLSTPTADAATVIPRNKSFNGKYKFLFCIL